MPKAVSVASNDDPVRDGDKKFNVTVATLLSADKDYGEYGPNKDGAPGYLTVSYPFISLDDPDDDSATACPRGMYGFYTDVADTNPLYNDYYGCIKCEPGSYAEENVDKLSCRQCPPGTFGIQVGSVGVQASTDWRGNDVDPGCMPCPNGTFNNQWGRESCFLCDPETQACGVGTVTPLPAHVKPWTWSQTVRTHWKVLKIVDMKLRPLLPFQLPIPPYGRCNPAKESCGKTGGAYTVIESNEENFQFVMLLLSALFTIFLYVCLKAIKYGLPEYWPKVKEIIKKIDKFHEDHYDPDAEEEDEGGAPPAADGDELEAQDKIIDEEVPENKRISGALATIAFGLVAISMIVLFWYQFFARNFEYAEALVPRDENTIMKKTWSDFEIAAEFVGYAGCLNGTADLTNDGVEDTEFTIEEDGFMFIGSRSAWCQCYAEPQTVESTLTGKPFHYVDAGSLLCMWSLVDAKALTSPTIDFSLKPTCDKCKNAMDEANEAIQNDWGGGTNAVKDCSDCVMASAQGIRWTVWASPVWTKTPNEFLTPRKDNNMVNGTTNARGGVFRGSQKSEIEFSLIPVRYNDAVTCETCSEDYAYRMQFSKTVMGDTANFGTKLEWHNDTSYNGNELRDSSTTLFKRFYGASLLDNFIDDASFVDEDLENEVHFRVVLAKSDVMLAMDIEKWMSYSEAVGIMGGIIEVVVVLVIAFMIKVEMFAEPRSPIRQSTRRMVRVLEVGIKHGPRRAFEELRADELRDLRKVFDAVDTDKSGGIDADELHEAMTRAGKNLSRKQTQKLFEQTDTDGDGFVDFEEFAVMFAADVPPDEPEEPEEKEPEPEPVVLEDIDPAITKLVESDQADIGCMAAFGGGGDGDKPAELYGNPIPVSVDF